MGETAAELVGMDSGDAGPGAAPGDNLGQSRAGVALRCSANDSRKVWIASGAYVPEVVTMEASVSCSFVRCAN